jgi:uncharacterized OB-fold protein
MSVPKYWREIPQRYRLEAAKCNKCGKISFPPRLVCPECKERKFITVKLPSEGKIVTFTIIHVGPKEFADETPYAVGIVELKNGVKITAQIVDCNLDKIAIDQKVKIEFRKIQEEGKSGIICYGYKCVPI